jgi:hypothetical protein
MMLIGVEGANIVGSSITYTKASYGFFPFFFFVMLSHRAPLFPIELKGFVKL